MNHLDHIAVALNAKESLLEASRERIARLETALQTIRGMNMIENARAVAARALMTPDEVLRATCEPRPPLCECGHVVTTCGVHSMTVAGSKEGE